VPHRGWLFRIADILDAVSSIGKYVASMEYKDFATDRKTVDAVIRNLITIGEAACHVPEEISQKYPEVPWIEMRAMRNLVVHEYFGVSDKILWDTIQIDLPPLVPLLKDIAENYSGE
jgi:uncharacterized protein with HEPN domain